MGPFRYSALPSQVVFGFGTRTQVKTEVQRLGCSRALVVSTPRGRAVAEIAATLGDACAGVCDNAVMHTPLAATEEALRHVEASRADCIVSVGGGSAIGLSKAIALRTDLPQVVLPTTYSGSEMTPIIGETSGGSKTTQRTSKVLPEVVIYDVELTLSLPILVSATSGIIAIAHGVEALYAEDQNPIASLLAVEGIAALAGSLRIIAANTDDKPSRSEALFGAWLCGTCLGLVGMALHHKLCHTLGGTFDLPHAETHTVVLPHAVAYNAPAAPEAIARVAQALGVRDAALGLYDLAGMLGAKQSLAELGMPEDGIDRAADLAVQNPYFNPRPVERDAIRQLIARAWAGEPPA
jgi:maleylacetate reductase